MGLRLRPRLLPAVLALVAVAAAPAAPAYRLTRTIPLGAPDRWDYIVADPETARVYVAHGNRVTVLDAATGVVVGQVQGMPGGTHGIAISRSTGRGYTDDGEKGEAVAFDLRTLRVVGRISAADDADGMARDPASGRVLVVNGDPRSVTLIDPATNRAVATVDAGEKLEYPAADGSGRFLVAGEEKADLVAIDARGARVLAHWPVPGCASPHGLAVDARSARAFLGCANARMMVVDTGSGRLVADLPIGRGNDAVAFDPVRRRVFSSNGRDGTVSVYREVTPDHYEPLPTIPTLVSARTMAADPRSGRLFVVGADTDPDPAGGRPHVRPGSVRVLLFDPVG